MDHTKTPFGGRLLRNWVAHPLTDRHRINERLDAVEEMVAAGSAVEQGGRSPGPPGLVPQPPPPFPSSSPTCFQPFLWSLYASLTPGWPHARLTGVTHSVFAVNITASVLCIFQCMLAMSHRLLHCCLCVYLTICAKKTCMILLKAYVSNKHAYICMEVDTCSFHLMYTFGQNFNGSKMYCRLWGASDGFA